MKVEERLAGLNLAGIACWPWVRPGNSTSLNSARTPGPSIRSEVDSSSMGDVSHGERGGVNEVAVAGRPEYDRRPWASSMARSR